ncbi:anti-sigma factor [Tersicoccus sp. Bi-70]|uniref:anti-sigma factor n=1 Tax=Tersicoccus sp. Bi-70 TaxID=1897634 RepID=UPI0009761647|nr:anti-sigma factor [Tersicoccus sp. Bi-70]OMH34221.1 hypothetical protein BGP79_03560 [Tersicoccus sp. Bi-70]
MNHLDGETIALLALGEDVGADARSHLDGCARCRAEVAELRALTDAARAARPGSGPDLEPPSDAVWARIRTRIDDDAGAGAAGEHPGVAGAEPSAAATSRQASVRPASRPGARPAGPPAEPGASRSRAAASSSTRPPGRRRRRPGARTWSFLAGAVVAALVVVAVVWTIAVRPTDQVLASAHLAPLASSTGSTGSGSAELQRTADGVEELRLQTDGDRVRGYPEVWLIAKDGKRMVSLGTLQGGSAVLPVPAGLDVHDYATVDVSDEPFDGNPAHSGDSILRGSLAF